MILLAEGLNVSGAWKKEHLELDLAVFSWRLLLYPKVRGMAVCDHAPQV
jgi:hypothetical protein